MRFRDERFHTDGVWEVFLRWQTRDKGTIFVEECTRGDGVRDESEVGSSTVQYSGKLFKPMVLHPLTYRSARFPCPTSRRPGAPVRPVSPTQLGGNVYCK